MQEFTPACTIKKVIKKRPVSPIANFFPIEETKNDFQVIMQKLDCKMPQKYVRKFQKIFLLHFFINHPNDLYHVILIASSSSYQSAEKPIPVLMFAIEENQVTLHN